MLLDKCTCEDTSSHAISPRLKPSCRVDDGSLRISVLLGVPVVITESSEITLKTGGSNAVRICQDQVVDVKRIRQVVCREGGRVIDH